MKWAIGHIAGMLRAALGLVCFLALAHAFLVIPRRWSLRRWSDIRAWNCLLWGFGIRVRQHGVPLAGAGVLYVSNHVSWTDIAVLGGLVDAGFVAKAEVGGWPVIGPLTRSYECLLVERERRGSVREQAGAVGAHLARKRGLILFPEGTTGEGGSVLPFRSSLFGMVAGTGAGAARVQPVTIRYGHADGAPLVGAERRAVAWIGDDELLPHAKMLVARGGLWVDVWFEEELAADHFANRKALAKACEGVIAARLAR